MDEFEKEPSFSIERIDGTFTRVYKSLNNPNKFRIEWDGATNTWTEHFQSMMDKGEVKKHG